MDLGRAQQDFELARFAGFQEEELIQYAYFSNRIKKNIQHVLKKEGGKGNIYFEKESLENIMKTLSRIYDVEIRFDSNKLPNEYFTGTIPGGGIQNALNILMLTSPFYYEMDGSVIVLKEK